MLDVLHYFSDHDQRRLLKKITASVAPRGVALIRLLSTNRIRRFVATWLRNGSSTSAAGSQERLQFSDADEVLLPFVEEGFVGDVRPMWGRTPFNSHLFTFRRKE